MVLRIRSSADACEQRTRRIVRRTDHDHIGVRAASSRASTSKVKSAALSGTGVTLASKTVDDQLVEREGRLWNHGFPSRPSVTDRAA